MASPEFISEARNRLRILSDTLDVLYHESDNLRDEIRLMEKEKCALGDILEVNKTV